MQVQRLTILGSTGSIGKSTLDVLERHSDRYAVHALTAHSSTALLAQQCAYWRPRRAVVGTATAAAELVDLLRPMKLQTEVSYGEAALCEVAAASDCDIVMAAIVGAAGLAATMAAALAGKKILLANKEALVMSGQLFIDAIHENGATLLPIDSEHNAVFQCLPHNFDRCCGSPGIAKILLTASGGPFLNRDVATLHSVTPEEAVAHPKWVMGRKISVDSATMMNKGLEVIEAHWLFGLPSNQIEVVIHPQSVIHSMVSYVDGSVLAQLGNPDMRTPIAHALAHPERITSGVAPLELLTAGSLTFLPADTVRFPCLKLAYDALNVGNTAPAVLNAANEVAVEAFLTGRIGFRAIDQLIEKVLNRVPLVAVTDMAALLEQDQIARSIAHAFIND
ncbi:MAG: 1-deoxy-D-xylulose-5-phosphate reductoisomerase [Pseudomonadota bacterium]